MQREYKGYIIEIKKSQPDPYEVPVYYWRVLKGGTNYGDNSKGFGCETSELAEREAMLCVDDLAEDVTLEDLLKGDRPAHFVYMNRNLAYVADQWVVWHGGKDQRFGSLEKAIAVLVED